MIDPYKAPDSDVQAQDTNSKTRWKIFVWFLLILQVISVVLFFVDDDETIYDFILEIVIYGVALLCIFGYAYNKKFLIQSYWKPVLPVTMIYDFYYFFVEEPWSFESEEEMYIILITIGIIILPILFFQYLALYRYAFKADEIWK